MSKPKKDKRVKNGEKTLNALIKVARKMFSERGYADTYTAEIARKAGVTRGALYHHFPQKKDLFIAVFEEAIDDLANSVIYDFPEPLTRENLITSTHSFITAGLDPLIQKIVFVDGPAILGVTLWRRYDKERLTAPLEELLEKMINEKIIRPIPVEAIAHIMAGSTNEAVRWISNSRNPKQAYEKIMEGFALFYDSFWV